MASAEIKQTSGVKLKTVKNINGSLEVTPLLEAAKRCR
jgi:hypothetical protein